MPTRWPRFLRPKPPRETPYNRFRLPETERANSFSLAVVSPTDREARASVADKTTARREFTIKNKEFPTLPASLIPEALRHGKPFFLHSRDLAILSGTPDRETLPRNAPKEFSMRAICVIPARYGSTRLPAKPLADLGGLPLIRHVYARAIEARTTAATLVATDDARIAAVITEAGGQAVLTSPDLASGTDRVAVVAAQFPADIYVNVQGDEPFVRAADIDHVVTLLADHPEYAVASLCHVMDPASRDDPNAVKVVCAHDGRALYFSRALIPYPRQGHPETLQHIGLYAYRSAFLLALATLPPSPLAEAESLEQLRFLQAGVPILMGRTAPLAGPSIDTPADLERARAIFARERARPVA
jgi:3-deoxy-manno-octulosonate cytidylyltransferase (CMP-KDO synthetase)